MLRFFVQSRLALVIASVVATAAIVGGVSYATIPNSSNGVISACYKTGATNPGALRVIDAQGGTVCNANEAPISWDGKKLNFRGAWSAATAYSKNDIVSHGGSSYLALLANSNVAVTNTTTWALLAKKGANGAPGPAGPKGQGAVYNRAVIAGDNYVLATPVFTATAAATCMVTNAVQMWSSGALSYTGMYVSGVAERNGTVYEDASGSQIITSNGTGGYHPQVTHTAILAIAAGETVKFGVRITNTFGVIGQFGLHTTYLCS